MLCSLSGRDATRITRGRPVAATLLLVAATLLLGSCGGGEGGGPTGNDGDVTAPVTVNVTPTLSTVAGDPALAPAVTSARVVVADASGGTVRLDTVIAISGAPTGVITLRPTLTSRSTNGVLAPVALTMRVELRSATGTEWSARQTISLVPGTTSNVAASFVRGPLANLDVTSVDLDPAPAPADEGVTAIIIARSAPAALAGTTMYLRSLDPTIASFAAASVTGTTAPLSLNLPGTARIVAASGQFADTIVVTVRARVASIALSSTATLTLASLGDTAQVTARALDPRGAEIAGEAFTWSVDNAAVVTSIPNGATGRVRAESNGNATLTVQSVRAPTLTASVPVVVRQVATTLQRIARPVATPTAGAVAGEFGVRVLDARGRGVAGVLVTWDAGGGVLANATQLTDANGEAVQTWRAGNTARSYTFTASLTVDALGARTESFTVDARPSPAVGSGTTAVIGAASLVADGASTTTVRVTLRDAFGNVSTSPDDAPVLAVSNGSVTALVRQSDGTWLSTYTSSTTLGTATFTVALPGQAAVTVGSLQLVAGPAAALVTTSATAQAATVGTAVAAAPTVRVTDAQGHPIAGVTVTFAVTAGGGTLGATSVVSDASGNASAGSWTLGTVAGTNTVTAGATGLPTVSFGATGTPDVPAALTFDTGPANTTAGATMAPVRVAVRDQYGNLVTSGAPDVSLALGANPGGGTLVGGGATAPVGGIATFAGLSLAKAGVGYTLVASAGALPAVTSGAFTITAAEASLLVQTSAASQTATVGTAVTAAPSVRVTDAQGNPVAGVTVTFAVTAGGGTLGATSVVSDAGGNASAGSWTLGTVAGANEVTVSATGLTSVTFAATGAPDVPAAIAFVSAIADATAGAAIPGVQVAVRDQYGNLTTNASPSVSIALGANPGGGTLTGGGAVTASGGLATFPGLSIDKAAAGYTLVATSGALPTATSNAFAVVAAAVNRLVVEKAGGGPIGTQVLGSPFDIRITALDAFDNVATGFTGTATITTDPAGGPSAGGTTGAFTAGVLATHAVTIGTAGTVRLVATVTGGTATGTSAPFDVQSAPVAPLAANDLPAAASVPGDAMHGAFGATFTLAAPGLLANDTRGVPAATIAAFTLFDAPNPPTEFAAGTTVAPLPGFASGSITVNADGSVSFTPPSGFTGLYEFAYRIQNSAGSSTATARIAIGVRPAAANDLYGPSLIGNVPINTATSTGFSVLTNDQGDAAVPTLIGASGGTATLAANGTFVFAPDAGFTGTATITYALTNGFGMTSPATVTLGVGQPLWFVDANAPTNGDGRYGSPFNCVGATSGCFGASAGNVPSARIVLGGGDQQPMTLLDGQWLIGLDGSLTFGSAAGTVWPLDAGPEPVLGRPVLRGAGGPAVLQIAANNWLRGITVGGGAQVALRGSNFGGLALTGVQVLAGGDAAIDLSNGFLTPGFDAVSSTGGSQPNVRLVNVATSGPFIMGTGANVLANGTGGAVVIDGGTGSFTFRTSISHAGATSVIVQGKTDGGVIFEGPINPAAPGGGVVIAGNAASTVVRFTGAQRLATGPTAALAITANPGGVAFLGGALEVATAGVSGIDASGVGTLEIAGSNNSVVTGGATAVRIAQTNVGPEGVAFRQVTALGGATGVRLDGVSGPGTVAIGAAGAPLGAGGDVRNATTAGIDLVDVLARVVLESVLLQDNAIGVRASGTVSDFQFRGGSLVRNATAALVQTTAGQLAFTNTTVEGPATAGFAVNVASGSPLLHLTNVTFSSATNAPVVVSATGTAQPVVLIDGGTMRGADSGPVVGFVAQGAAGGHVRVTGATLVTNGAAAARGVLVQAGTSAASSYTGSTTYIVENNTITATAGVGVLASRSGTAPSVGSGLLSGFVRNNTIGATGACPATGVRLDNLGQGRHVTSATANAIPCGTEAIALVQTSDGGLGGELHATVTGHTLTIPTPPMLVSSNVHAPAGTSGRKVCMDVRDNSFRLTLAFNNGILSMPGWPDATPPTTTNAEFNTLYPGYITGRNRSPFSAGGTILNFTANADSCLTP